MSLSRVIDTLRKSPVQRMPTRYRILCLGDFHFGESYSRAGAQVIRKRGREAPLAHLLPFVGSCDAVVVNLETPIVDPADVPSPWSGQKDYIHWASPSQTPEALRQLGVSAVSLANNHTLDHGTEGLTATFDALEVSGIPWFGAGRNLSEARRPFRLELPEPVGGGTVDFHGMFQRMRRYDEVYRFYATESDPGCAPVAQGLVPEPKSLPHRPDSLTVAFPHWGRNYRWRTVQQRDLASALLSADFDVVIGHGSHCLQQVERRSGRWVVFGIGNGVFLSGGGYQRHSDLHGILPLSAWTIVEITRDGRHRRADLKLYPVYSDNRATGFLPRPVTATDFDMAIETMRQRTSNPARFDLQHLDTGSDELGSYLRLSLGTWPIGARLKRQSSRDRDAAATKGGARSSASAPSAGRSSQLSYREADTTGPPAFLRAAPSERADQVPWGRYEVSPQLLAVELLQRDYQVRWVDRAWFFYEGAHLGSFSRTTPHLTSGEAIRSGTRKDVTNFILQRAEISIPNGQVFGRREVELAARWAQQFGSEIVVKPVDGGKGRGVTVGVTNGDDFRVAFDLAVRASRRARRVLVESRFRGDDTRFFVIGGRGIAAISRRPPQVIGDGYSNVQELIDQLNERRSVSPAQFKNIVHLKEAGISRLRRLGHQLTDIPPDGEVIVIDERTNASTGGATCDVTDEIHPSYFDIAGRSCSAIPGLALAGVDILASDFSQPATPTNHVVLEVNTKPAVRNHHFPDRGATRDVAAAVIDYCTLGRLPEGPLPPRSPMPGDRLTAPYP